MKSDLTQIDSACHRRTCDTPACGDGRAAVPCAKAAQNGPTVFEPPTIGNKGGSPRVGRRSVAKGKRFERDLVHIFSEAVPHIRIARGFQYRSGAEAPDVDLPGFWLEAKVGARTNPRKALRQAQAATRGGRWPLAVCKDDRQTPMCVMALPDFVTLYRQWICNRLDLAQSNAPNDESTNQQGAE